MKNSLHSIFNVITVIELISPNRLATETYTTDSGRDCVPCNVQYLCCIFICHISLFITCSLTSDFIFKLVRCLPVARMCRNRWHAYRNEELFTDQLTLVTCRSHMNASVGHYYRNKQVQMTVSVYIMVHILEFIYVNISYAT